MIAIACAACTLAASVALPAPALAAPSSASIAASVADSRAKAASAEAELASLRSKLTSALAEFDTVDSQLEAARQDIALTQSTLTGLDSEIADRQSALDARIIAMYKSSDYDVLAALLSVRSFDDIFSRLELLSYLQKQDTELLDGLATAREQSAFLQQQQAQREADLTQLREQTEARRKIVESAVARQEQIVNSLGASVLALVREQEAAAAFEAAAGVSNDGVPVPPVSFDPNTLVSDAKYLDSGSLTAAGIQAFLDKQSGSLRSYVGRDHNGVRKSAAEMIADASVAWGVSPKVVLVTLQKEQSLISKSNPSQNALDWAMGCGKTDSVTYYQYKGFGNQIWSGAQKLISNRSFWRSGISLSIDRKAVYPTNASTHALYRYTPHFGGATSFWKLYWRYWGDPIG